METQERELKCDLDHPVWAVAMFDHIKIIDVDFDTAHDIMMKCGDNSAMVITAETARRAGDGGTRPIALD